METHPPNDNFIRLERLVARAVVPYLGYLGLYEGGPVPTIRSVNRAVQPAIRRPSEGNISHSVPTVVVLKVVSATLQNGRYDSLIQLYRTLAI